MRLLVLGGTAWLGRYVAATALARGHAVTCMARGESGTAPRGVELVVADRERPDAFAWALERTFDAVIDVSRQPGQVRRAAAALSQRSGHYGYVSSASVYVDNSRSGQDETAATFEPLQTDVMSDMTEYGAAKVACERAVLAGFGPERSLIVRSGLIGGPDDHTARSGYWPWRFAHPSAPDGIVLIPDSPDLAVQLIDVRDLAAWLVVAAEGNVTGTVNAVGDVVSLSDFLETSRRVAGHTGPVLAVPSDWLREQHVAEFMGTRSLPLWIDDPAWHGFMAYDPARARAAGLQPRPLAETLAAVLDYENHRPAHKPRPSGLTDDEERVLIDAWRAR